MEFLPENLRFLRRCRGISQAQLALHLEWKRTTISAIEEGKLRPDSRQLIALATFFRCSIDGLLLKDLRLTERVSLFTPEQLNDAAKQLRVLAITLDEEQNENIELVPVAASAGYVNGYADPTYIAELQRFQLPFLPVGTYRAFEIKGDSMLPLQPGSIVVGEYVANWNELKDGDTYIIILKQDGILYKRVFNHITADSTLILHSDNTAYPPYSVPIADVLEIWKAVLHISHANKGNVAYRNVLQLMQQNKPSKWEVAVL